MLPEDVYRRSTIHNRRVAARTATYPNRAAEDAAVIAVDTAVVDAIRPLEAILVNEARGLMRDRKVTEDAAANVIGELRNDLVRALEGGAKPTASLAEQYERLRAAAIVAQRGLRVAIADANFMIPRATDPYVTALQMWEKYPQTKPSI